MARMKNANWRRLLLHMIKSCGYEPTSVRLIANPGVSSLPGLLLEMHFDIGGRKFHFHIVHPKIPDERAANEAAFRAAAVLAACASGSKLPPTTLVVERIAKQLTAAAKMRIPLIVHPQHDGCIIMGQCLGHDENERRIRHDIRLTGGDLGIVLETDIRILEEKLRNLTAQRDRMALPLTDRYLIDPVFAAIIRAQGWTSSQVLDVITGAVSKSPETLDFDAFRVHMKQGRLRLERWRTPTLSVDEHNIRIVGATIPQTAALCLLGERFEQLAHGTPFDDMKLLRINASAASILIKVGREPLTLGAVVAMLGTNLHDGDWLVPGEQ